ncbi:MAG: hypothetical protein KC478_08975, partial [Bacteriovoracaceae bacterium]|nr:hypothetical protein [Bacteriovoracaceae bacterium]
MKYLAFIALFISAFAFGEEIDVSRVDLNCEGRGECVEIGDAFKHLKRSYVDLDHLKQTVRLYALNEGIYSFEYALLLDENDYVLKIDLGVKRVLLDYEITVKNDPGIELPTILPIREMEFVDEKSLLKTNLLLQEVIQSQGYPDVEIKFIADEEEEGVNLKIIINPGRPIEIEQVRVFSDSSFLKTVAQRALSRFKGKSLYLQEIKSSLEELRQLFIDYGYYLNDLSLEHTKEGPRKAIINISIKSNELHVFKVMGNKYFSDETLKELLKNTVLSFKRKLAPDSVKQSLISKYADQGFIRPEFDIGLEEYKNINGELVNFYRIEIKENFRAEIENISFNGNSVLSSKRLRALFFENAPEVVKSGIFQREYVENFISLIRKEYIIRGYVNVLVEEPRLNFVKDQVYISYRLREGVKAVVDKLVIKGVGADLERELQSIINNKEKKFFNPTTFKSDLEMIENRLRQQGYFYASIKNKNSQNIVRYKNDNSNVDIRLEIDLDKQLYVDQIIIVGNRKTRTKLIRRELELRDGDIVTRDKIQQSQTNLLGLGIFSSVLIEPIPNKTNSADLLVSVREKDFGLIELAPGIRTDIGLKLSANVTYNNLDGMNKRIAFKGQVNQRFNLNSLDERRREESNSLVEYDVVANYSENHILNSDVNFSSSISSSRRRFFSFDADIKRIS